MAEKAKTGEGGGAAPPELLDPEVDYFRKNTEFRVWLQRYGYALCLCSSLSPFLMSAHL